MAASYHIGRKLTELQQAVLRIEEKQNMMIAHIEKLDNQIYTHERLPWHGGVGEALTEVKNRVRDIEKYFLKK